MERIFHHRMKYVECMNFLFLNRAPTKEEGKLAFVEYLRKGSSEKSKA